MCLPAARTFVPAKHSCSHRVIQWKRDCAETSSRHSCCFLAGLAYMENDANMMQTSPNQPSSCLLVSARCHTVVCELLFWLWPEDACGSLSEQHEHHRLLSKVVRETASYILWTPAVLHLYRHAQRQATSGYVQVLGPFLASMMCPHLSNQCGEHNVLTQLQVSQTQQRPRGPISCF